MGICMMRPIEESRLLRTDHVAILAGAVGIVVNIVTIISVLLSAHQYVAKMETRIALLETILARVDQKIEMDHKEFVGHIEKIEERDEKLRVRVDVVEREMARGSK